MLDRRREQRSRRRRGRFLLLSTRRCRPLPRRSNVCATNASPHRVLPFGSLHTLNLRRLQPRRRVLPLFEGRPALGRGRVGVGNPAGSCCSLDAARRRSGFAAGNAAAAFRTSSMSSVFKEPQHHGAYHRPLTRSPPPFLPTPEGAVFPVAIPVSKGPDTPAP